AYTFFAAQGKNVSHSLVEEDKKEISLKLLQEAENKSLSFLLPFDHVVAEAPEKGQKTEIVEGLPIPKSMMALDIGPHTRKTYREIISKARTIFWNGPMGVFEIPEFANGTMEIAHAIADSSALSVIGGGDSVAAVAKAGVSSKINHISTGGGASLEYIALGTLPGLEALRRKDNDF
ncbi:MAG: phosphoglycerate kinase, partial [Acidobacteriota bacterium]